MLCATICVDLEVLQHFEKVLEQVQSKLSIVFGGIVIKRNGIRLRN